MLLGQVLNALLFAYMAMYASNVDKMGERFGQQARRRLFDHTRVDPPSDPTLRSRRRARRCSSAATSSCPPR